ncbi:MAG: hypothetical protein ACX94D_08290 [Henriciella sp.]
MSFVVLFALSIFVGAVYIWSAVTEQGLSDTENFLNFIWGLGFAGLGLICPIMVGEGVRPGGDDAPLVLIGDWIRGCLHLQSSLWEWLKEATGF